MNKTSRQDKAARAGYSLLEMLVFIALFGVIVNLCGAMFLTTSRLSALTTLALDRISGVAELESEFRSAVVSSAGTAPQAGSYKTGDKQLVLRLAPQEGLPAYRIFGLLGEDTRLSRMDLIQRGDTLEMSYFQTYPQRITGVKFQGDVPGDAIWMEFQILTETGERAGRPHVYRFAATPRVFFGEMP